VASQTSHHKHRQAHFETIRARHPVSQPKTEARAASFLLVQAEDKMLRSLYILILVCLGPAALGQTGGVTSESFAASPTTPTTFNKHIAPIVYQHCADCHHPGEVAPFSLLSYADVRKHAAQIKDVTRDRYMPPWKSVEGHGQFLGERRLKQDEINLIARWVEEGAAEGDAKDLPPAPTFRDDWKLGKPDIIVTMPEPYRVRADGSDDFRNFVFDLNVPAGKYIKAAEFHPSNRRVVHHAALMIDTSGEARKKDQDDLGPGFRGAALPGPLLPGCLATWTPGRDASPLPAGLSLPWTQGNGLILQLHLHPSGKPELEQSSIGFYLTDEPPRRSMVDLLLIDTKIDIAPGERAYSSRDEFTLPLDVEVLGVFPHMHLIGRDIKITAQLPGQKEAMSLLWINDWDFNWQGFYQYVTPVKLPAGTHVVMETIHDNSAENIRNPNNPPKEMKWGEQTTDEMSLAILQLVPRHEADRDKLASHRRRVLSEVTAVSDPKIGNDKHE
jgi:mono/diheme cytochrome c family protein